MSPSMAMEINSKANVINHQSLPNRHHVRNLWPSVGGGLPGGKPIKPTLGGSTQILQRQSDYYNQSTSYAQNKPVPGSIDFSNVNDNNYYKSSQVQTNQWAATNVVIPSSEYSQYYNQQPKYFQHTVATTNHWYTPPSSQMQAAQYYYSDPTTMVNQVILSYLFMIGCFCLYNLLILLNLSFTTSFISKTELIRINKYL